MSDPENKDRPPIDLRSIFLGPKAENAEAFERLLLEAFRDHVFWRRNFHPEDGFRVTEMQKRGPEYESSISGLSQELLGLLGELKGGVPFFSPRYIGHMTSDLTMASLIGYFATMLYNPNNVAAEASPVTTRMELEVGDDLARMVGYAPGKHWSHLTSGGTVANFEAMWAARNVHYLPVAARWAAEELGLTGLEVELPRGEKADLRKLELWDLLNIAPRAALDLVEALGNALGDRRRALGAMNRNSLARLGYQEYGRRLRSRFGDALPPGVLLVPSTAHYSWEKICHVLGMGSDQLVHVPVDDRFRMDPDAFAAVLQRLSRGRNSIVGCVAVIGTTEESAVDRVDRLVDVRAAAARDLGIAFPLHADAAWGGYAVSVTRDEQGALVPWERVVQQGRSGAPWPSREVYSALCSVGACDSVTIDPHKFGFVPYPAGAVCFADRRVRDLMSVEAPYLFHGDEDGGGQAADSVPGPAGDPAARWGALGQFIFEGSKPGAAAAGVWMSHQALPLDRRGYGHLIAETARGAMALHDRMEKADWGDFRLALLPRPDLNIVCFGIGHPKLKTLGASNEFVGRMYRAMSVGPKRKGPDLDYFVTQTFLRCTEYGRSILPVVEALGFGWGDCHSTGGVAVLRCTVMDPFMDTEGEDVDFIAGFVGALKAEMERQLNLGGAVPPQV